MTLALVSLSLLTVLLVAVRPQSLFLLTLHAAPSKLCFDSTDEPEFDRCRIPGTAGCGPGDGGAGGGCAPMPGAAPVFETSFDDVSIDDFVLSGDSEADWVIEEGELRQREPMATAAKAPTSRWPRCRLC